MGNEIKTRSHDKYKCNECNGIFYIGTKMPKSTKPFCPYCGENIATRKCDIHKRHWTIKELTIIDDVLNGKLTTREADRLLSGRTFAAVKNKVDQERKKLKRRDEKWTKTF